MHVRLAKNIGIVRKQKPLGQKLQINSPLTVSPGQAFPHRLRTSFNYSRPSVSWGEGGMVPGPPPPIPEDTQIQGCLSSSYKMA